MISEGPSGSVATTSTKRTKPSLVLPTLLFPVPSGYLQLRSKQRSDPISASCYAAVKETRDEPEPAIDVEAFKKFERERFSSVAH